MAPVILLVTFYSRSGSTETRALSLAVGAVQERALIRLRRVADAAAGAAAADGGTAEALARMRKEYVVPAEADVLAADAVVIAPTSGSAVDAPEWAAYLGVLRSLGAAGRLRSKVGAVVSTADRDTSAAFAQALSDAGLSVVAPGAAPADAATPEAATAHGRRVAAAARALKDAVQA